MRRVPSGVGKRHHATKGRAVNDGLLDAEHLAERLYVEVGALARRRFIEGKLDAADMEAWARLAFPSTRASQGTRTLCGAVSAAPMSTCGSHDQVERAARSTSSPIY